MNTYREEVYNAINEYMADHEYFINLANYDDADDLQSDLYDDMFVSDEVTGNASGSYTFNSYKARENVLADIETVKDALNEFGVSADEIGDKFLNEEWEYFDVTARCYVLGECLAQFIEDNRNEIEKAIEDAKEV